mmetsp:Transcript_44348/g.96214  ORF Transcript_44348/g.96214 Transcript_44348/m.96214 type:complete len:245 (-) Transcript_44348:50-784(-)
MDRVALFRRSARIKDKVGLYSGQIRVSNLSAGEDYDPRQMYDGYGVLQANDGSTFAGFWRQGRCIRGVCTSSTGSVFQGDFTGYGTLNQPSGASIHGPWKKGTVERGNIFQNMMARMFAHAARLEAGNAHMTARNAQELEIEDVESGSMLPSEEAAKLAEPADSLQPLPPVSPKQGGVALITLLSLILFGILCVPAWRHSPLAFGGLCSGLVAVLGCGSLLLVAEAKSSENIPTMAASLPPQTL